MTEEFDRLRAQGNEKFRNGNYGGSLVCYTRCIDLVPTSYALYCNRAAALIKVDSIKEAEEDLKKSLEINSDYVPSYCQLGFLMLYEGNTVASLENYVKAVKISSKRPHQLERFKSQLKEAIRLAEGRARQQGYSQNYIDSIITDDVRICLDSYHSLRSHASNQPTVATGSVSESIDRNEGPRFPGGISMASSVPFLAQLINRTGNTGGVPTTEEAEGATGTAGTAGTADTATASPNSTHVQGPNGFSASFNMAPNQTNGLMDFISQISGQANIPEAVGTEREGEPIIPTALQNTGTTSTSTSSSAQQSNVHMAAHNAAQGFMNRRVQAGQPLNGADFARGLATTIASQLRGLAQVAVSALRSSSDPSNDDPGRGMEDLD
ncbi:hypothetical protein FOA43_003850 [Brettanomyces nanus]|uniref:Small glutamine-rich tetratricopeptide repeat-containing protein alpha n=1 Tax=Eeniella nana TaxID=13502 RepID=A0A875S487_EENNA|nr:uncharacterized protein FOA43_003850 [Brettanomyces nanus]QPG76461.1 hypothetical protein FOA43_003850 [Brettanomyces nanus]